MRLYATSQLSEAQRKGLATALQPKCQRKDRRRSRVPVTAVRSSTGIGQGRIADVSTEPFEKPQHAPSLSGSERVRMEAGRRVAAETEVRGRICRHGDIDKNGLLMEAAQRGGGLAT